MPRPPRNDHWISQLGRLRNDPYAWLKVPSGRGARSFDILPGEVRAALLAEIAYANAVLVPLERDIARFHDAMVARASEIAPRSPVRGSGWHYTTRLPEGGIRPQFLRIAPDGTEQSLFDEAERAAGHDYYRATDHQHSPDHRHYAWAEDVEGDDRHRICILDIESGTITLAAATDGFGYGGLTFSASSCHLFWLWRDAHSRPTRLYRTSVSDGATTLVYEEHDPALFMQVARTAAGGFVALTIAGPETSEVRLIPAGGEGNEAITVQPREPGTRYRIEEWVGELVMMTDAGGAVDRRLLALDPVTFAVRRELVPPREGISLVGIFPFAAALVRLERAGGLLQLVMQRRDGSETLIRFEEPAYTIDIAPDQDYAAPQLRIAHHTPASPHRWIDIDLATGAQRVAGQEHPLGYAPADYRVERIEARALDGEMVPITVLSRRDLPPGEPAPLLLNGYGAYGFSREPFFSLPVIALVDAGFRYAIAHVRGGAERGQAWFHDARRERKRNSMIDFIACAEHLIAAGYARRDGIVAHGISAGGLLVTGAMNMRPDLFAGVIAQVPFVDMLNTMSDADHPLVPLFRPDWGDPLADPAAYDSIAAISPYENVVAAAYPPVLCTAGLKDDRVPYWEPAKLVAALRDCSTSGNPAILRLDPDSGHQASGDRESEFAQAALLWAFARHCVGQAGED